MSKLEGWGPESDFKVLRGESKFKDWQLTSFKKFKNGRCHWVLTEPDKSRSADEK